MITYFLLFFLFLVAVWSILIEPNCLKVERLVLEAERLPFSFRRMKVVHLSDIHFEKIGNKERKVLSVLNRVNPDLVFITGDIIDEGTRDLKACAVFLKELSQGRQGKVFAVFGNHDYRNKNFTGLAAILKENNIEVLINESRKIQKNNESFFLVGVDDPSSGRDNIEKAMEGVGPESFKIFLAHSPEIFRKVKGRGINLVLTGHTHGAQVNLPMISYFVLPLKYDKKYKKGLFFEESTHLYVSRGIGETLLPVRLNAFPEITLIEFKN